MQAAVQKYVDSSISKTINCPEDIAFEAFKDVYRQAYDSGCKGCTTYRPNDITGAVLASRREETEQSSAGSGETAEIVADGRARSEERRVGEECVSKDRYRGAAYKKE